jgi:hypothetical protein
MELESELRGERPVAVPTGVHTSSTSPEHLNVA